MVKGGCSCRVGKTTHIADNQTGIRTLGRYVRRLGDTADPHVTSFDPTDVLVTIGIALSSWNLKTTLQVTSRLDKVETELRVEKRP